MNYKVMAAKLDAVRKEIRKNVWHLNIVDILMEKYDRDWERFIWSGESSYYTHKKVMTFDEIMEQYPLSFNQAFEVGKFTGKSKLKIAMLVIKHRLSNFNLWNKKGNSY